MFHRTAGWLVAATLGFAATLITPVPAQAAPDCSDDSSVTGYCATGTCREIQVNESGVQCLDNALDPLLPPAPPVRVEIGVGAGS